MTVYVMAHVHITDREGFGEYAQRFGATLAPFGGRVIVVADDPDVLEGEWPAGRTVVLAFDDAATARAWWESEAYQEISALRRAASTSAMMVAPGWEP
ncbi:MAG: DUF1330 domain-containing protein [Acidimicrobiales bacterium]